MLIRSDFFSMAGVGKINEDACSCRALKDGTFIALVADGVGGNYGGGIASALAEKVALETLESDPLTPLTRVLALIAEAIKKRGAEDLISSQMATTLSLCVVHNDGLVRIAHVGDSRIYHLRRAGILQKTRDQTEVAALIAAGILSNEQAKTYPRRTVLQSALAAKGSYEVFQTEFNLEKDDRVVLLTDGVYRLISKARLRDISINSENVEQLALSLKEEIDGRNDDDATVVVFQALEPQASD